MPIELCVNGINGKRGKFVEIKAKEFFSWIGERNPYTDEVPAAAPEPAKNDQQPAEKPKKKGFWARLFG